MTGTPRVFSPVEYFYAASMVAFLTMCLIEGFVFSLLKRREKRVPVNRCSNRSDEAIISGESRTYYLRLIVISLLLVSCTNLIWKNGNVKFSIPSMAFGCFYLAMVVNNLRRGWILVSRAGLQDVNRLYVSTEPIKYKVVLILHVVWGSLFISAGLLTQLFGWIGR